MNRRSYVKKVAKHLACSKARRDDYVRDLESDIDAALEGGETWGQVEQRMGDPRQIAREFNGDLSENELAAGKKRKRLKIIGIVVSVVAALVLIASLVAWWFLPHPMEVGQASGLTEQKIVAQAETVVALVDADDVEGLQAVSDETLANLLTSETLEKIHVQVGADRGAFVSFGSIYVGEHVVQGQVYEPVSIVAVYENTTVTYTLAFNGELELTALYLM